VIKRENRNELTPEAMYRASKIAPVRVLIAVTHGYPAKRLFWVKYGKGLNAGVLGAIRPKEVNAFRIVTLVATLQKAWFCCVSKTLSRLNNGMGFDTFARMRRPAVLFSGTTNSGRVYPREPTICEQSEPVEQNAMNTDTRKATFIAIITAVVHNNPSH
jgi:hypothetical protein